MNLLFTPYHSNFETLLNLKQQTDRPDHTVTAFINAIGYDAAQQTIAVAINTKPHDGRISDRNRAWALSVTSDGIGDYLPGIDSLHPAHLDQIADYMRKAERPREATEAEQDEPETETETAPEAVTEEAAEATETEPETSAEGYTITPNAEYNNLEISFEAKPSEAVREALKGLRFRWHSVKKVWYGRATAEAVREAISAAQKGEAPTTAEAPQKPRRASRKADQDHIRIYWNGIKIDGGELVKCSYSLDNNADHAPTVSIYEDSYKSLPRDILPVVNETDIYTDYFENDRATITPAHPLYKYFRYAAMKAAVRGIDKQIAYWEKNLAAPEKWRGYHDSIRADLERSRAKKAEYEAATDPGQPTAADLAEIDRQRQEAENARRAEEHAADLARRERYLVERCNGRRLIEAETAAHPVEDGAPHVVINWSEHPAFYDYADGELILSLEAAENILRKLDDEQHETRGAEGGYYKTSFVLHWTGSDGEDHTYTGRYDLGDGDGGMIAHIREFVEWSLARMDNTPDATEARAEARELYAVLGLSEESETLIA